MDKFKRKNVTFKVDDPEEMKLYNELQKVAHGDFSRITKDMWRERLRKENQNEQSTSHQS